MGPWGTPGSEWAALSSPRQGLCVRIGSEGIREAWIALIQRGLGLGLLGGGLVLTAQGCCRGTRQRLTSSPRAQTSRILGHVSLSFPHHHERTWLQRRSWDWLKN